MAHKRINDYVASYGYDECIDAKETTTLCFAVYKSSQQVFRRIAVIFLLLLVFSLLFVCLKFCLPNKVRLVENITLMPWCS